MARAGKWEFMVSYPFDSWRPYVPVAQRRRRAAREIAEMKGRGRETSPVEIAGRKIATTFWGAAWCDNLESYSDYSNRLPRGRTYVRNGSVVDLQIEPGRVRSLVHGSSMYQVDIAIKPLPKRRWNEIKGQCAGQIGSLVELLQGSISKGVMEIVTRDGTGLFPAPREISLDCSCPDWATMCKHVAATLYGVGARLDDLPELLFTLRGVDPAEMVAAAVDLPRPAGGPQHSEVLGADDLSSIFGIDIDAPAAAASSSGVPSPATRTSAGKRATNDKPRAQHGSSKRAAEKRRPAAVKLPPEVLARLHARAFELIEDCEILREWIHDVQSVRGRLYLWREPEGHVARITPLGPRSVLLDTRRGRSWAEVKRGALATVLQALAAEGAPEREG